MECYTQTPANRINSRERLKQERIIEASAEAFLLEAHLGGVLLENTQGQMAENL